MKITLISAVAVCVLAGCGKAPAPQAAESQAVPPQAPSPVPSQSPASIETKELLIFCGAGRIPQTVIDQFAKETGIAVSVENYASKAEMLAQLLHGGRYDIIQPGEDALSALIQDGMLYPIAPARIPNLKNIGPKFRDMGYDPGNKFSVPYLADPVGIVINTGKIPDDIKGFADVFAQGSSRNIVVLDEAREIVAWGFLSLGIPINQVADENLGKVRPLLARWLPRAKFSDSPTKELLAGDAAIGILRGSEAAALLNADPKFRWVIPAEGAHLAVDSLAIPKASANAANAEKFLNFVLRPDISKQISDALPAFNPNLAARDLLTPAQRANPASYPSDKELAKMQIFEDIGGQTSKIDEIVAQLKSP